jgi:hypothetical protein
MLSPQGPLSAAAAATAANRALSAPLEPTDNQQVRSPKSAGFVQGLGFRAASQGLCALLAVAQLARACLFIVAEGFVC